MKVKIPDVRLADAYIWEARAYQGKGDAAFNAKFIVVPGSPADQLIQKAIKEVATAAFGDKADQVLLGLKGNTNKFCYHNGDLKADRDGYQGNFYLSSRRKAEDGRPDIRGPKGSNGPVQRSDGVVYSGCYGTAIVDIWAQDDKTNGRAINCKLLGFQKFRDGDAFAAGASATDDDYEDLSDGANAPSVAPPPGAGGGFI